MRRLQRVLSRKSRWRFYIMSVRLFALTLIILIVALSIGCADSSRTNHPRATTFSDETKAPPDNRSESPAPAPSEPQADPARAAVTPANPAAPSAPARPVDA